MSDKLKTYLLNGVEVPEGTAGAVAYETDAIAPGEGLYKGGMTNGSCDYRTAMFVDGGQLKENQSVTVAVQGGSYDASHIEGAKIVSENALFNGVMVNDSEFKAKNLTMTAKGSGGNDFKGFGAGFAAYGATKAELEGYVFDGEGVVRHAVFAGGSKPEQDLTVTVKDSFVRANGSLHESKAEGMSGCPWMLGISADGHARATMCDGYSTVNYENDILLSDGWGVLSVDDTGDTVDWGKYSIHLNVKNSVVDATTDSTQDPSCYATYSIGGCENRFYGCVIGQGNESKLYEDLKAKLPESGVDYNYNTVPGAMTYAAVVANEHASAGWYDGSVVNTKYGVMYHKTSNVRYAEGVQGDTSAQFGPCGATEVKDSTFNTKGAAFLIKACTPGIEVVNSKFNSEKGVIAQLMTCDDPGMGAPFFSESVDTAAPVAKDPNYKPYDFNLKDQTFFRKFNVKNFIADPQLHFADCNKANGTALVGNFFNSISVETEGEGQKWWGQNLVLSFDNCDIEGACSSSTALHDEYSFFTAKADNEYGAVAVDAFGNQLKGTWEKVESKMPGMGGGDMPGGPDMGGMPPMGGPGGPDMGGMPPMGGMPGMSSGPKFQFNPEYDAEGKLVTIPGEKYTPDTGVILSKDATMLGGLTNVATATVNNGVWVKLAKGSTWTAKGVSYLTRLEVEEGSTILGEVSVDGQKVTVEPGKVYTGSIIVCE